MFEVLSCAALRVVVLYISKSMGARGNKVIKLTKVTRML